MGVRSGKARPASQFVECVQACARDQLVVDAFNKAYGASWTAPVEPVLRDPGTERFDADTEAGRALAYFILFVYSNVWRLVKRSHARGKTAPRQSALDSHRNVEPIEAIEN
jgi:hypothetical protein